MLKVHIIAGGWYTIIHRMFRICENGMNKCGVFTSHYYLL